MRHLASGIATTIFALVTGSGAAPVAEPPDWCRYTITDAPRDAPRFADFPVPRTAGIIVPLLDVRSGDARLFRSMLRDAARGGPNFAGRYIIASWGCGTGCLTWAVIDARTGKVTFDKTMNVLDNNRVDFGREAEMNRFAAGQKATFIFGTMLFRRDSALLITLEAPNEDQARDGIAYYRWTGVKFEKLRFYPAAKICPKTRN
jgi:hypothetical protein